MGSQPALEALRASLAAPATIPLSDIADVPARQAMPARLEMLRQLGKVFVEDQAESPKEIEEAFKVRYQVYCLDRAFEKADHFSSGMERDHFDDLSLHCLLRHRASARPIGTVRLVVPPKTPTWFANLPLAEYAPQESMEAILRLPAGSTAEVSRFAVTRSAREIVRTAHDSLSRHLRDHSELDAALGEKLLPYISLLLIRGLVRMSMQHGITHWCLAAEPSLLRRLRNFGLHFENAGPLVEHRGLRQVCFAELQPLLERSEAERPEFWDVMTEGGLLQVAARARSVA